MTKEYIKGASVLVFNDKGELALQLRASNDKSFPGHWDFSAGGHIEEGEEPEYAGRRELKEEIGIEAEVEFLSKEHFQYPAWDPSVLREVDSFIYKAKHNGPFQVDPKEVDKVQFFTLEKIGEMIESGVKFHPELVMSWDRGVISQAASN